MVGHEPGRQRLRHERRGGTESPPLESLQKFIGASDLWPIGSVWNYHAGKAHSVFDNIKQFSAGIDNRYGPATGAADYARKAELQNYETARSFFEAWSSHEYTQSFGVIFWMLSNAWPSVHWNLYDYFFKPGGGYFGAARRTSLYTSRTTTSRGTRTS